MITFLLLAANASIQPAEAAPAAPAEPPRAVANLASYLSDADYPTEALRKGEQGTVRFRLSITTEGTPGRCEIVESSGSASLDAATCRVMIERARFRPARNSAGDAVPDQIETRIRWVIPESSPIEPVPAVRAVSLVDLARLVGPGDYPAEARRRGQQGSVQILLLIGGDGRVEQCMVGRSSGSPELDSASCALARQRARFRPARDATGAPAYDALETWIDWVLPPR